jgi:hypothetical protein
MIPLLIAGGTMLGPLVQPELPDMMNHTLTGIEVKASNVVTRNRWGTPMMPTGDGGYSLIAIPDPKLIEQSLIQPPNSPKGFQFPEYRPGAKTAPSSEVSAPLLPVRDFSSPGSSDTQGVLMDTPSSEGSSFDSSGFDSPAGDSSSSNFDSPAGDSSSSSFDSPAGDSSSSGSLESPAQESSSTEDATPEFLGEPAE